MESSVFLLFLFILFLQNYRPHYDIFMHVVFYFASANQYLFFYCPYLSHYPLLFFIFIFKIKHILTCKKTTILDVQGVQRDAVIRARIV